MSWFQLSEYWIPEEKILELSKAYENKVDVINVITALEIEMLIILNEDKYNEFKKFGKSQVFSARKTWKYPVWNPMSLLRNILKIQKY